MENINERNGFILRHDSNEVQSDSRKNVLANPGVVPKSNSGGAQTQKHYTQMRNEFDANAPLIECEQCKYTTKDMWQLRRHITRMVNKGMHVETRKGKVSLYDKK